MKVVTMLGVIVLLGQLSLCAEIRELRDPRLGCVQVAIDFEMLNTSIDADGALNFTARASLAGSEVGLLVKISNPKRGPFDYSGKYPGEITRSEFELRTMGTPTANLERLLSDKLSGPGKGGGPNFICGPYNAKSNSPYSNFSFSAIWRLTDVGVTYDKTDSRVELLGYMMEVIIDPPLARMTVLFAQWGAPGGITPVYEFRERWINENRPNHPSEPMPPKRHGLP